MAAEPEQYFVTHHATIEVTQMVTATSKAEAIRKVKAGEWDEDDDMPGAWLDWHTISDPVAYKAEPTSKSWGPRDV